MTFFLSKTRRASRHDPARLKAADTLTIDLVGRHNARNLWAEFSQLLVPAVQVPVGDFPLHVKHLPKRTSCCGTPAGQLPTDPPHQTPAQNPGVSQDTTKGGWPLSEDERDKGEHPASLETRSQPISSRDTGNSPSCAFTPTFSAMTRCHPWWRTSTGKVLFC